MTGSRWRRIELLFNAALDHEPADRPAFFDRACGEDASLRQDVEALLAADAEGGAFLAESALSIAAGDAAGSDAAALVGRRLGSYELVAHVGSGGMGDVYRARDVRLDRHVAIKVLSPRLADDSEFLEGFAREARAISQLSHPHICALYDIGREDAAGANEPPLHYLVLEFLEGETLAERLRGAPLPFGEAVVRAAEICEALAHAHRHGIVHGDVKPGNVIVTETGARLVDFGLACRPTDSRRVFGTLPYMAPEQVEGADVDARADIWAIGVVLHEMLSGRCAFGGTTEAGIAARILGGAPAPLAPLPDVPPEIDRLIRACLVKRRDQRLLTAHDIAARLRDAAATTRQPGWKALSARIAAVAAAAAAITLWPQPPRTSSPPTPRAADRPVAAAVTQVSGVDRDLAGVTTKSIDAYRFYAEGVNLHERGRDVEAAAQLRQAVRIDPTFAMALAKLAITETAPNLPSIDMAAARRDSRRAFEQSKGLPERERLYVEGIYHRYRGDLDRSIERFTSLLAIDPDHISSRQTLAATYQGLERYQEAAAHFEALRRRGVPLGISYFGLSQTYEALGKFDLAVGAVQEFLRRNPDDARAYRRLAEALIPAGRLDEAMTAVDRADGLGHRPRANDDVRRTILLLQERMAEAEAMDRSRLKSGDTSDKHGDSFRLAQDLLLRGRSTEARTIFAAMHGRYWVASLWLEQGDAARALAEIRRIVLGDDDEAAAFKPEVLSLVVQAHARLGHRADALTAIERLSYAADRSPNPVIERRVRWARGVSALEMHDPATAIRELSRAAALLPPNQMLRGAPIVYTLANAYRAAGHDARAAALYEQFVASSVRVTAPVDFVRSLYFLGQIAERRGDTPAALRHYARFVQYWGDGDLDRDRVADARRKLATR